MYIQRVSEKRLMAHCIKIGSLRQGFTIIELLLVLLLVSMLASLATPVIFKSISRAEESSLKENLFVLRRAIDNYYADNGHYPEHIEVLVDKRYIRKIPVDPVTGENNSWKFLISEDDVEIAGIIDIFSGSEKKSIEGTPYGEW